MKKENKPQLIFYGIALIFAILFAPFAIPTFNKMSYGKFTYSIEKAKDHYIQTQLDELECTWGAECRGDWCYCSEPPCKRYNIEGKNCVREGYTGKGFLGMTDFDTIYYVCEGYGRMAIACEESFHNKEDFSKYFGGS